MVESEVFVESNNELEIFVGDYVSGNLFEESVDIVLKLLMNIVKEPENAKFRKIKFSHPKIKEVVVEVSGGIELLRFFFI